MLSFGAVSAASRGAQKLLVVLERRRTSHVQDPSDLVPRRRVLPREILDVKEDPEGRRLMAVLPLLQPGTGGDVRWSIFNFLFPF